MQKFFFALLAALLTSAAGGARAQTASPETLAPLFVQVSAQNPIVLTDAAKTVLNTWKVQAPALDGAMTVQLWLLQNHHLRVLQTAEVHFDAAQPAPEGTIALRCAPPVLSKTSKTGAVMQTPSLALVFPSAQGRATSRSGSKSNPQSRIVLPSTFSITALVKQSKTASQTPDAFLGSTLWAAQFSQSKARSVAKQNTLLSLLETANEAASHESQIPLRPLLGILNQNTNPKDALLVLTVTYKSTQTAPTLPIPAGDLRSLRPVR